MSKMAELHMKAAEVDAARGALRPDPAFAIWMAIRKMQKGGYVSAIRWQEVSSMASALKELEYHFRKEQEDV